MTRAIDLFTELVRAQIELWNELNAHLESVVGISLAQFQALAAIREGKNRVQEMSEEMRITVGATSKLVDRLERDDLARRSAHPSDRRSSIVSLTDHGARILMEADDVADSYLGTAFSGVLSEGRAERLLAALMSLRADSRSEATQ